LAKRRERQNLIRPQIIRLAHSLPLAGFSGVVTLYGQMAGFRWCRPKPAPAQKIHPTRRKAAAIWTRAACQAGTRAASTPTARAVATPSAMVAGVT